MTWIREAFREGLAVVHIGGRFGQRPRPDTHLQPPGWSTSSRTRRQTLVRAIPVGTSLFALVRCRSVVRLKSRETGTVLDETDYSLTSHWALGNRDSSVTKRLCVVELRSDHHTTACINVAYLGANSNRRHLSENPPKRESNCGGMTTAPDLFAKPYLLPTLVAYKPALSVE